MSPQRKDELRFLLDQADQMLVEPMVGEAMGAVQTRHVRAQYALLKAQMLILLELAEALE